MENFKKNLPSYLLIIAACFALYGQTLGFHFVWDDYLEIVSQGAFRDWANLGKFFTVPYFQLATGGFAPFHRPMMPLMTLLISTFSGTNPFGYHLANVLLFSFTAVLYYAFLRKLPVSGKVAGIAAAVFIFHPVHAEAVSWSTARPVLLSGLCFISILISSAKIAENPSHKRWWLLSGFLYLTGLLSYHSILTAPVAVFFMDQFEMTAARKKLKTRLLEYSLYAVLTAAAFLYILCVFRHTAGEADLRPYYNAATANIVYTDASSFLQALLTPLNTLTRYSEKLLFPYLLTPDAYFKSTALSLSALASFIVLGILSFLLTRLPKNRKAVSFSLVWMTAGLLTVLNFVPQGGLFADRYAYIASMGFGLWLAAALEGLETYLSGKPRLQSDVLTALFLIIFGFYGMKTYFYSQTWSNEIRFWLEASIQSPQKARTHNKLGILLAANGHNFEAEREFRKVLELAPEDYVPTYAKLADVLDKTGKRDEAAFLRRKYEVLNQKAAAESEQNRQDPFAKTALPTLRVN